MYWVEFKHTYKIMRTTFLVCFAIINVSQQRHHRIFREKKCWLCGTILGPIHYMPAAVILWQPKHPHTKTLLVGKGRETVLGGLLHQPLVENMIEGLRMEQTEFSKPDHSRSVILGKFPLSLCLSLFFCDVGSTRAALKPQKNHCMNQRRHWQWKSSA